jgi:hypothetical protein
MRHWGLWLIAANLCVLIGLVFLMPHLMVAPGPLIPAHSAINTSCFSCHAPFQGVVVGRCTTCHTVATIGIRTTKGLPIEGARFPISPKSQTSTNTQPSRAALLGSNKLDYTRLDAELSRTYAVGFHQSLIESSCTSCHTDHTGPQLVNAVRTRFDHALLRPEIKSQCSSCHAAPKTPIHAQSGNACASCHTQAAWKPSTFDHKRFFALTGPHNVPCATCHNTGDFSRSTCFSCHEHQPDQIRASHAREGIMNINNCASCHKSGSGEGREGGEGDDDDDD